MSLLLQPLLIPLAISFQSQHLTDDLVNDSGVGFQSSLNRSIGVATYHFNTTLQGHGERWNTGRSWDMLGMNVTMVRTIYVYILYVYIYIYRSISYIVL